MAMMERRSVIVFLLVFPLVEAKKAEHSNVLKEIKRLCKEFGFTAGMLEGSLAEERSKK